MHHRVRDLMDEGDPEKRLAKARQLRAEIWDLLGQEDREKIVGSGVDLGDLRGPGGKID